MGLDPSAPHCPHCAGTVAKYGELYHRVYSRDGGWLCEQCGGILKDGKWGYQCESCKSEVAPGALFGLFVPRKCATCESALAKQERDRGSVCGMCRQPDSRCCC